jgi:hypothetical protein
VTLSLLCSAVVPFCDVDGGAEAGAGAANPAGGAQPGAARQGPGGRPRHLPQEGHRHFRPLQKCGGERGTRTKAYTLFCHLFCFLSSFLTGRFEVFNFFSF